MTDEAGGDSIFRHCYTEHSFVDRLASEPGRGVDVIIPVINTNPLWRANLVNFYGEIPIARLLIGDGGATDDTVHIAREFPRVEIIDQRGHRTLGMCLRDLIERVETEWFVYLHADIQLPQGWFDTMANRQGDYDWFECNRCMMVAIEYLNIWQNRADRAYSGSQMGRRAAFDAVLPQIDDDFLYRNEDIIIRELVEKTGGRCGRVDDTFHHHQVMNRGGLMEPDFERVEIFKARDFEFNRRTLDQQVRGLIKYTQPHRDHLIQEVKHTLLNLVENYGFDRREIIAWTARTNPAWKPHVKSATSRWCRIRRELGKIRNALLRILGILVPALGGPKSGGAE